MVSSLGLGVSELGRGLRFGRFWFKDLRFRVLLRCGIGGFKGAELFRGRVLQKGVDNVLIKWFAGKLYSLKLLV